VTNRLIESSKTRMLGRNGLTDAVDAPESNYQIQRPCSLLCACLSMDTWGARILSASLRLLVLFSRSPKLLLGTWITHCRSKLSLQLLYFGLLVMLMSYLSFHLPPFWIVELWDPLLTRKLDCRMWQLRR
jgi:hypothetical protein